MSDAFAFAALPAFELQPPVARWLAGWLPQMAHWDWEPAPGGEPNGGDEYEIELAVREHGV